MLSALSIVFIVSVLAAQASTPVDCSSFTTTHGMDYAILVDAGSTGSRFRVYTWPDTDNFLTDIPDYTQIEFPDEFEDNIEMSPGISEWLTTPTMTDQWDLAMRTVNCVVPQ